MTRVAILLATMQGQRYLGEQLASIVGQTHGEWTIHASDDGSGDATPAILERHRARLGEDRLLLRVGPGRGPVANFLSLACDAAIAADYYAFCDQDDVWEPDKLARAIAWLAQVPPSEPALYCARTRTVDADNRALGLSPLFGRPPAFANALVQNIGGGNTMVFNHAACALLRLAGSQVNVVSHDWWAYLLVSGCGGRVHYDAWPALRYRQHAGSLVGPRNGWRARLRRAFKGRFRSWTDRHLVALQTMRAHLTPASRQQLDEFAAARGAGLWERLAGMRRSGVYRQTLAGSLWLWGAALLNRI